MLAALSAFLVLGAFDTLIDTPRFLMLLVLLCCCLGPRALQRRERHPQCYLCPKSIELPQIAAMEAMMELQAELLAHLCFRRIPQ